MIKKYLLGASALALVTAGTMYSVNTINELSNTVTELSSNLDTLTTEKEDLLSKYNELSSELTETKDLVESLTTENTNLKNTISEMNRKVRYSASDVSLSSNTTSYQLKKALNGTKLYDYAESFARAEKKYGVNAIFLASVCAHESAWGTSDRARYQNNLSGYKVYSRSSSGHTFQSESDSIMETARLLKEDYLTPSGQYHNGKSLQDVNIRYCLVEGSTETDYNWSRSINNIAQGLVKKANS